MKFTGTVLALDLAIETGWAYGEPGSVPSFGHVEFARRGSERAMHYRGFRQWLEEKWNKRGEQPDLIVYEAPAPPSLMAGHTTFATAKLLIGFCEHLEEWTYQRVELREANVSQVRAHFIGGNFKSAMAKAKTFARCHDLGWKVSTLDEGDACALWDYQMSWLRPDLAANTMPLFQAR